MTLRWTEEDLDAHKARKAARIYESRPMSVVEAVRTANLIPGGKPRNKARKGMNKWEAQFSQTLEHRKTVGELVWWAFEPFRIRLAEDCWYRPDFVTVDAQGKTEIWEVKGFMREAARLRLRIAAEKLPYPFYLVRKNKGQLKVTPL